MCRYNSNVRFFFFKKQKISRFDCFHKRWNVFILVINECNCNHFLEIFNDNYKYKVGNMFLGVQDLTGS